MYTAALTALIPIQWKAPSERQARSVAELCLEKHEQSAPFHLCSTNTGMLAECLAALHTYWTWLKHPVPQPQFRRKIQQPIVRIPEDT